MPFGAYIKTFIYLVSSSLLYPALILLCALILGMILYAGSFFAEWLERVRLGKIPPERLAEQIQKQSDRSFLPQGVRRYISRLERIVADPSWSEERVENVLQEATFQIWKSLDRLRILVRVAPGLGLIGTLIPMGTGLAALGQGDMSKLTSDLVIAFTTTVVGLAIGLLAFFFLTVKNRWVEEDVKNMELATEVLTQAPQDQDRNSTVQARRPGADPAHHIQARQEDRNNALFPETTDRDH